MNKIQYLTLLQIAIGAGSAYAGFSTPGLWPWQLPACAIGGWLTGNGVFKLYSNKK